MDSTLLLKQAAETAFDKPSPELVVEALLIAEKTARKDKPHYHYSQLLGNWRLRFITGTKKTRAKAGVVLGAGRYIPRFVTIQLSYSQENQSVSQQYLEMGRVQNTVQLSGLRLSLSGPVKFLSKKNILVFDFTQMRLSLFGIKLYDGYIRQGEVTEKEFYTQTISQQAFFAYFLVKDEIIAARGKGGGLALWQKVEGIEK